VSSLRYKVEHGGIALVRGLVRVLPAPVVRAMGAGLGLTFYAVDRVHRNVALTNLATAFPQRTLAERRQICRAMFVHFGRLLFELLRFSTLSPESMRHLIEFEGEERARAAYAQGKGVLFFTGHFGYWEVHAIGHGMALQPIGVLARALDNPMLNELLEQVRGKTGNFVIYRQGAVRKVLRALAAGQGVALLIDQHMNSPDAIYVDFFERPAATTSMLAALALRTGAPVVPVFALPLPGGRYRLIYEHAVPPPDQDSPDAIREFTQRCTDVLEMYVRRHPSLWLWMHRRWRDAPLPASTPGMFPHARADASAEE
jgi:KDO2-lipid IV(A) lauroyltransferase